MVVKEVGRKGCNLPAGSHQATGEGTSDLLVVMLATATPRLGEDTGLQRYAGLPRSYFRSLTFHGLRTAVNGLKKTSSISTKSIIYMEVRLNN